MIFNCYNTKIDFDEIRKQIALYEKEYYEKPRYIIINCKTRDRMKMERVIENNLFARSNDANYFQALFGVPIAVCNKLSDGEVELV